jgi:hypothetical protein
MARDGSFLVRVLGDVDDLQKKLRSGSDSVQNFGDRAKTSIKGGIDDAVQNVTSRFGALGEAASSSLSGITGRAVDAGGALGVGLAGGAAAATAGIVALAVQGVSSMVELAGKVRDVQRVTGATAEESSRLVAVMDDMGIEADKGASAMFKLSRTIETNEDALRRNGIEVAKTADGTTDLMGTLLNVADAYDKAGGGAAGNKIAFEAFGKAGADLIPILEKGRGALEQMFADVGDGEILSQEDLQAARDYELAMDALGDSIGSVQRELGRGLVPAIADTASGLAVLIERANEVSQKSGGLGQAFKTAFNSTGIPGLVEGLQRLGGQTDEAKVATEEAAEADREKQATTEELEAALEEETAAFEENEEAIRGVTEATLGAINASLGYRGAVNSTEDALATMTEKQKEASAAKGRDKTANEELERSVLAAEQAVLRQAAAFAEATTQEAAMQGVTLTATQQAALQREELQRVANTLAPGSPLRQQLEGYIGKLNALPGVKTTVINADTIAAQAAIERVAGALARVPRHVAIEMAVDAAQRDQALINRFAPPRRASGGPLFAGVATVVGEAGPEIVTSSGAAHVYRRGDGPAGLGLGAAQTVNVTLNMPNYLGDKRQVMEEIRREFIELGRRNGGGIFATN